MDVDVPVSRKCSENIFSDFFNLNQFYKFIWKFSTATVVPSHNIMYAFIYSMNYSVILTVQSSPVSLIVVYFYDIDKTIQLKKLTKNSKQ